MSKERYVNDWKGFVFICLLLLFVWFLMAPEISWYNVLIGIGCAIGITLLWSPDLFKPGRPMRATTGQVFKTFLYLFHLGYNVVLANIAMVKIVLNPKLPISPVFILVKTKLKKDMTKILYANSITLTPGTITVDLNGDRLLVHAITEEAAQGVYDWYMQDKLREIELMGK